MPDAKPQAPILMDVCGTCGQPIRAVQREDTTWVLLHDEPICWFPVASVNCDKPQRLGMVT